MEIGQERIEYEQQILCRSSLFTEETDAIVPDALADIGAVLCAFGTPTLRDQTVQNGRVLISGTVDAAILYETDTDAAQQLIHVPISFARIEESDRLKEQTACFVGCRVISVEAAAVNSRKIKVTARLETSVYAYEKQSCDYTASLDYPGLEMMQQTRRVELIRAVQTERFTILDDVMQQDATGLTLLHAVPQMTLKESRALGGKLLLKGEVSILCLALQEDGAVRVLTAQTPFTQIIPAEGATEEEHMQAILTCEAIDCRLEPDGLLSYTINAAALMVLRKMHMLSEIEDLYLPGRALKTEQARIILSAAPQPQERTLEGTASLPLKFPVSHVISLHSDCCSLSGGEGALSVSAAVRMLYLDDAQKLRFLQRMIPISFPTEEKGDWSEIHLSSVFLPEGAEAALKITAKAQYCAEEDISLCCITALEAAPVPPPSEQITMLMQRVDESRTLWEIAKSCGSTVEAIRQANELAPNAAEAAHTMLLIPQIF